MNIIFVGFQQVLIRIAVTGKKPQRVILPLFDIAESHDLAELLRHFIHTVRAAVRLNKRMPDQVFIQIKGVERFGVKPGEHHVDYKQNIDLRQVLLLHAFGDIFSVGVKGFNGIRSAEHLVVIINTAGKQLSGVLIPFAIKVLIGAITENSRNFILRRRVHSFVQFFQYIIVFAECFDGVHREKGCINILSLRMDMPIVVLQNVFSHLADPVIVMIECINVNTVLFAVYRVIQLLRIDPNQIDLMGKDRALIFHGKSQYIAIRDRVFDHIAVQTGIPFCPVRQQSSVENIGCCPAIRAFVCFKNRRAGKTDVIGISEMTFNIGMHPPELGAVTLIDDKDNFFVPEAVHQLFIAFGFDRVRHLLDRGDNQFLLRILQLLCQDVRAVGTVDTIFFKGVVFIYCLIIQVFAVNQENHFVNAWFLPEQLS